MSLMFVRVALITHSSNWLTNARGIGNVSIVKLTLVVREFKLEQFGVRHICRANCAGSFLLAYVSGRCYFMLMFAFQRAIWDCKNRCNSLIQRRKRNLKLHCANYFYAVCSCTHASVCLRQTKQIGIDVCRRLFRSDQSSWANQTKLGSLENWQKSKKKRVATSRN